MADMTLNGVVLILFISLIASVIGFYIWDKKLFVFKSDTDAFILLITSLSCVGIAGWCMVFIVGILFL